MTFGIAAHGRGFALAPPTERDTGHGKALTEVGSGRLGSAERVGGCYLRLTNIYKELTQTSSYK